MCLRLSEVHWRFRICFTDIRAAFGRDIHGFRLILYDKLRRLDWIGLLLFNCVFLSLSPPLFKDRLLSLLLVFLSNDFSKRAGLLALYFLSIVHSGNTTLSLWLYLDFGVLKLLLSSLVSS